MGEEWRGVCERGEGWNMGEEWRGVCERGEGWSRRGIERCV